MSKIYLSSTLKLARVLAITIGALCSSLNSMAAKYTLLEKDITIDKDGLITKCTYDFAIDSIIIPSKLGNVTITGIASTTMYGVFYNKNISYVEFANSMTFIGDNAFSNNKITKLTVPNNIKHIGNNAFANSKIQELVLSNGLIYIGSNAFYYNNLENVTLPNSITVISSGAFASNKSTFKTFILPKPTDANFEYWMSSDGEKLTGGSSAKNDFITYTAKIPYTLTSDDVVVTNGYIVSCSYSFEKKYITIPSTLDGQQVIGIKDGDILNSPLESPFSHRSIKEINLPSTLKEIGIYAFLDNNIDSVYIPSSVEVISTYAFSKNSIRIVAFEKSTNLKKIDAGAFKNNPASLKFKLPTQINNKFEAWVQNDGKYFNAGDDYTPNLDYSIIAKIPYTITNQDVVVDNGVITKCTYDFSSKFITIPTTLNNQKIIGIKNSDEKNLIFSKREIAELNLPSTLEFIGDNAFFQNNLNSIDFSKCTQLKTIGASAFYSNLLDSVVITSSIETIGNEAFRFNIGLDTVIFNNNSRLNNIGASAFSGSNTTIIYKLPTPTKDHYTFTKWLDSNNKAYNGGQVVSFTTYATSPFTAQYTLKENTPAISLSDNLVMEAGISWDRFSISNIGNSPLIISNIILPNYYSTDWKSGTINSGESKSILVTYTAPTRSPLHNGIVEVVSNAVFGTNTLTVEVLGSGTAVTTPSELALQISPNPVSSTLSILPAKQYDIQIFSINGTLVFQDYNTNTINTEALPKGYYFIDVKTEKRNTTLKFIKK